jgi:hypothetical protein
MKITITITDNDETGVADVNYSALLPGSMNEIVIPSPAAMIAEHILNAVIKKEFKWSPLETAPKINGLYVLLSFENGEISLANYVDMNNTDIWYRKAYGSSGWRIGYGPPLSCEKGVYWFPIIPVPRR